MRIGDVWQDGAQERCTVAYEDRGCLTWDPLAADFEPADPLH